jgi:hypothetical protein
MGGFWLHSQLARVGSCYVEVGSGRRYLEDHIRKQQSYRTQDGKAGCPLTPTDRNPHGRVAFLASRLSPSSRFSLDLGAKPPLAKTLRHVDLRVIELPWQVIDALALAVHVTLDHAFG